MITIPWEFAFLGWLQGMRSAVLDAVMVFFSSIGNYGLIWIAVSACFLISKKHRRRGVLLLSALAITTLAGEFVLKKIVCRNRPFVTEPAFILLIPEPSGFSFPSVHTAAAFCAVSVLWKWRRKAGAAALIPALLIAFSRMYLYVHFPTDVLGGIVLGVVCALVTNWLFITRKNELTLKR